MKSNLLTLLIGAMLLSSTFAQANLFTDHTTPKFFTFQDENLEMNFSRLKLKANVNEGNGHLPWSDTYWPSNEGGISVRYQLKKEGQSNSDYFKYLPHSFYELQNMRVDEISLLSPAEKFDILRGRYDYPLVKLLRKIYDPKMPSWQGICHGWTPAAANMPEPLPMTVVNKDGITIPFGSSDVKAMISYYYAWEASQYNSGEDEDLDKDGIPDNQNWGFDKKGNYWQKDPSMVYFIYRALGERSGHVRLFSQKEAKKDMNPAAIHVLLANLVGRYHRSFNVDVDRGQQVWNQPIFGYKSEVGRVRTGKIGCSKLFSNSWGLFKSGICSEYYDKGVRKELEITTEFKYIIEVEASMQAHGINPKLIETSKLRYTLQLDAEDNIIGGYWQKVGPQRFVDFMWRASRVPFLGEYAMINDIYKAQEKTITSYAMNPGYTKDLQDITTEEELSRY